jgi:hypothetical protein
VVELKGASMVRLIAICCLIALPVLASASLLQIGEIGIFGDEEATSVEAPYFTNIPFPVYLFARPDISGITGWEASISIPPTVILANVEYSGDGGLNIGSGAGNFIVGVNGCQINSSEGPMLLATLWLIQTQPNYDDMLCLGASTPSSVGGGSPAFSNCAGDVSAFTVFGNGCVRIGSGLCGETAVARTGLGFENVDGSAGSQLAMDLLGYQFGSLDCVAEPADLRSITTDISWDPAVASLLSATPKGLPADWVVSALSIGSGTATLELSGPSLFPIAAGFPGAPLATLLWQTNVIPGSTTVRIEDVVLESELFGNFGILTSYSGLLSTIPVANESSSFGALKARY